MARRDAATMVLSRDRVVDYGEDAYNFTMLWHLPPTDQLARIVSKDTASSTAGACWLS